ncbi:MAG: hypothetical protein IPJ76_07625 [Flavobacteriales bacterium]|nr:MAG: hypothetical protein IPJ76_07625 [Flavobacteriales bacterium]
MSMGIDMIKDRQVLLWALLCTLAFAPRTARAQPPCYGLIRPAFTYAQYGQTVTFMDSSITNGIDVQREWTLGDGTWVMDSLDFGHTYAGLDSYEVCLTLTDTSNGQYCQTSFCRTVRTDVAGPCPGIVYPDFYQADAQSNAMLFQNASSGTYEGMLWELGDGTTDTVPDVEHTYLWPGKYYVALNMLAYDQQNQNYCISSIERWVDVDGNGATCTGLFANFSPAPVGGALWSFTSEAMTSLAPIGVEVWTFGDGNIGFGPYVVHDFPSMDGAYQVCMLTAATDGLTDTCYAYVCHTVQLAATGIDDPVDGAVRVWPVPFTDHLSLALPTDGAVQLTLTDARGAEVGLAEVVPNGDVFHWAVGDLAPGLYVLRVNSPTGTWARRVVRD